LRSGCSRLFGRCRLFRGRSGFLCWRCDGLGHRCRCGLRWCGGFLGRCSFLRWRGFRYRCGCLGRSWFGRCCGRFFRWCSSLFCRCRWCSRFHGSLFGWCGRFGYSGLRCRCGFFGGRCRFCRCSSLHRCSGLFRWGAATGAAAACLAGALAGAALAVMAFFAGAAACLTGSLFFAGTVFFAVAMLLSPGVGCKERFSAGCEGIETIQCTARRLSNREGYSGALNGVNPPSTRPTH